MKNKQIKKEKELLKKLGVKSDGVNLLVDAPGTFLEEFEKNDVRCLLLESSSLEFIEKSFDYEKSADYIHLFVSSIDDLKKDFLKLKEYLKVDGALWVSWPKKTSVVESNLDENKIREIGLEKGLVDVKVVSVNEVWSGLKFVYRSKDRNL